MNKVWGMFRQMFEAWSDDYVPSMGAALAYYTLFSVAPLLLIVVAIAGMVFGQDAARGEIARPDGRKQRRGSAGPAGQRAQARTGPGRRRGGRGAFAGGGHIGVW